MNLAELENQTPKSVITQDDFFDLPIDTETMFSNQNNIYKKSIEKRQRRLLKKISFIKPFLCENEKILLITTGCSPMTFLEQCIAGWLIFLLKRSLFIFTNERIFHVPTNQDFSYRCSIAQISYADCFSLTMKGRSLIALYKSGRTEKFVSIAHREKKKVRILLNNSRQQGHQTAYQQRTHLCPQCTSPLIEGIFTCPQCSLEFKNEQQAKKVSIIYPGGGYFYTRHFFLGIGDAVAETYLTLLVLIALYNVILGYSSNIPVLCFVGLILLIEKAITVYECNHFIAEYIPVTRKVEVFTEVPAAAVEEPDAAPQPNLEQILSAH